MKQKHQIPDSKPKHEGRKVMHEPRKKLDRGSIRDYNEQYSS